MPIAQSISFKKKNAFDKYKILNRKILLILPFSVFFLALFTELF